MENLYNFDKLIEKFLQQKITVHQFERQFLDKYLEDNDPISDNLFYILDEFFVYVDAFTDLPMEADDNPEDYINEEELREYASKTLERIRTL